MSVECSQQVLELYHLLLDEDIELVPHFIPGAGFWFDADGTRYYVKDDEDGLTLKWTERHARSGLAPDDVVKAATERASEVCEDEGQRRMCYSCFLECDWTRSRRDGAGFPCSSELRMWAMDHRYDRAGVMIDDRDERDDAGDARADSGAHPVRR